LEDRFKELENGDEDILNELKVLKEKMASKRKIFYRSADSLKWVQRFLKTFAPFFYFLS